MKKKLNYKFVFTVIILIVLACVSYAFKAESSLIFKNILESKWTFYILWISNVIIFIVYYIFSRDKEYNSKTVVSPNFNEFFDIIGGGFGIATGLISALTILKGLYLQNMFNIIYFKEITEIDQVTIGITMSYLAYYLGLKTVNILREVLWVEKMEKVESA